MKQLLDNFRFKNVMDIGDVEAGLCTKWNFSMHETYPVISLFFTLREALFRKIFFIIIYIYVVLYYL